MSLSSLPAELKFSILDHLDPESSLNFALSSKPHFLLCKDLLQEHARLSAKYSIIRPSNEGFFIWDFTKEVLQDPRKGWYVRELNLVNNRPGQNPNLPEGDNRLFKAAAEKILPLYQSEAHFFDVELSDAGDLHDEMDADIDRCFEAPILVILVHYLPKLRSFRLTDHHMSDTFQIFMRQVAVNYQDTSLARSMPLQHLKLAAIAHHDTENSCSIDWAVYFMCVPSVKTFAAFMMGSENVSRRSFPDHREQHLRYNSTKGPVSNVEEIIFQSCQLDPESLNTLLPMAKNLRRFDYQAGGYTVADQEYGPRRVIRGLTRHAGHSLEELRLAEATVGSNVRIIKHLVLGCELSGFIQERMYDISSVSAQGFKKLKALSCEMGWLLKGPQDESSDDESDLLEYSSADVRFISSNDLRDNLPASLEYLHLNGINDNREWRRTIELFKTTNANTPKLTLESLCIERMDGRMWGFADDPQYKFANSLLENIWSGHNVWL